MVTAALMDNLTLLGQGDLAETVAKQVPSARRKQLINLDLDGGGVICWLPIVQDPVDQQVQSVVAAIDQAQAKPARIVVWSPAGTADDATPTQLAKWWGKDWRQIWSSYLYMVKMIDELEYPYTVVRSLPLAAHGPQGVLYREGEPIKGQTVAIQDVAKTVVAACQGKWPNESIGVGARI